MFLLFVIFDTRGSLSSPACDVHVWLKITSTAIKIEKETTKYKGQEIWSCETFTETAIFIHDDKFIESEVSLKILSHVKNVADLSLSLKF